jgi:hypothetical protein
LSYREHPKHVYGIRHRHGTFKRVRGGKQWIGGNQFVNASNNYEMKTKHEPTKETEKPFEPRKISHSERMQRLAVHRLYGNTH